MSALTAAKTLLAQCLFVTATMDERDADRYPPPLDNFKVAIEILRDFSSEMDQEVLVNLPGGITIAAGIKVAQLME